MQICPRFPRIQVCSSSSTSGIQSLRMSRADIDKIKQAMSDGLNNAYETAAAAEAQLNSTTQTVSTSMRKGVSSGISSVYSMKDRLQDAGGTAQAQIKSGEDAILSEVRNKVKYGIQWCQDYPLFSYTGAAVLVFSFPAPRAFLLRNIFGIFQSQESAFRAASEKFAGLSETAATLTQQRPAAVEKARLALQALNEAKANAASTVTELSKIHNAMNKLDQGFLDVRESMLAMKHKDVVALRADVARTASEVRSDKKEVSQLLSKLESQVS